MRQISEQERHLIRHMALHYHPETENEKRFLGLLEDIIENEEVFLDEYFEDRLLTMVSDYRKVRILLDYLPETNHRQKRFIQSFRDLCDRECYPIGIHENIIKQLEMLFADYDRAVADDFIDNIKRLFDKEVPSWEK
jgi:hypothetical protein